MQSMLLTCQEWFECSEFSSYRITLAVILYFGFLRLSVHYFIEQFIGTLDVL